MTTERYSTSQKLYARACELMPGGVNSPVRAFKSVGGTPVFVDRAKGAHFWDADGNKYIDFVGSWGPMILGHAHPKVIQAVQEAAARGTSYGAPTRLENEFAELVCELVPSVEVVRLVNSGTEATMSALRLARGFTGRPKIVKFRGCYHGHEDSMLVEAGSGVATLGIPGTPGVLAEVARETITAPFNDFEGLTEVFARHGSEIACCIIEPVTGNMGCIPPAVGYLEHVRELCTANGALLIFDEVMTGFRVALGGAQGLYGVTPDLTTLGKVIGGGLPVGAYGGRADIMAHIAPSGPVYQAGTLSGNPLAVSAGMAQLRELRDTEGLYERLGEAARAVAEGLCERVKAAGFAASCTHVGGMFSLFFKDPAPTCYAEVKQADIEAFNRFFWAMLDRGVYMAPSAYEAGFVSTAHTPEVVAEVLAAADDALASMG
ncbi:MAG: glutamate-1-semialdehyde-2,1-aminomutase [Myxococcales bacterium]|nr:glutamate-1-semialdehyde-2,1-aminomutase [Myxococcales bacterium]